MSGGFEDLPGPGWSLWPAPAKLNLCLHIVGRRADGYHLLQTVFQLLDWGDRVALRVRDDGRLVLHRGAPGVAPEQDLAWRAATLLQQETDCPLGADIAVEKRVPMGGGFGGGSSDAATVLRVLDRLWHTGLGPSRLAALGARLGADGPVFVGGHSAWAEGVGEQLTPMALPRRSYLLAAPGVAIATAALFQAPDLTRNAPRAKMENFLRGDLSGNVFEPLVLSREPAVARAFRLLEPFGRPRLTGTGSGCFVAFDTRAEAEAARAALDGQLALVVADGVDRSPLLDALAER